MNSPNDSIANDSATLDPPGSIAIVGAGPLGVEAALYGRFLGYNVNLIEAVAVGHSLIHFQNQPLPILPDRCLSPLAISALRTQQQGGSAPMESPQANPLPMTYSQWISEGLVALTETDLLRGRLRTSTRVTHIETIAVRSDQEGEDTSDIPPDFRLRLTDDNGQIDSIEVEAVILAVGTECDIDFGFSTPADYFYRIGATPGGNLEQDLINGLREIVGIYAGLAGRTDLDLYRPRRV